MLITKNKSSFNFIAFVFLSLIFLSSITYHNQDTNFLLVTKALLILLTASIFWNPSHDVIVLPKNSLAITMAIFWFSLLINIPLGNIPENNAYTVWLIALLPTVFFIYQLIPNQQNIWNKLFSIFIITATGLSLYYIYQINSGNLPFGGAAVFPNRNIFAALLNIIILASSAYFIKLKQQKINFNIQLVIGTALFIMIYAMAMTQSRGGLIAFFAAYILLFLLLYKTVAKRILISHILLTFIALILANTNLQVSSNLINNLATLSEPSNAGSSRFLIWEATWQLIQNAPLFGNGAGTFPLLYPQYRLATENSGGLFAHNDYLQIWSEMGLIVLIAFIALLLSTAYTFIKYWRSTNEHNARIETAGLFCGLSSVAIHSLFTFNLYILSMLIISALFLGRFNHLCTVNKPLFFNINPGQLISQNITRLIIVIMAIFGLLSLASSSAHQYYYQQGIAAHKLKKFDLANSHFISSNKFFKTYASLVSQATLLSDSIVTWPESDTKKRQLLFNQAHRLLDEAETLNPFRLPHYNLRGYLYTTYPEFSGRNYVQLAKDNYQKMLVLNPRHFKARYLLAKLLVSENKPDKALILLEHGLNEYYSPWQNTVPYLQLIKALRIKKGDQAGANALTGTIEKRQRAYQFYENRKKSNNL